jgi:hypothetical protein
MKARIKRAKVMPVLLGLYFGGTGWGEPLTVGVRTLVVATDAALQVLNLSNRGSMYSKGRTTGKTPIFRS